MILRYEPIAFGFLLRALIGAKASTTDPWPTDGVEALLTASGADAIRLALSILGCGGRVVVPAWTCDRVVAAIRSSGNEPHFVDLEPGNGSFCINQLQAAMRLTPRAVILTRFFGRDPNEKEVLDLARSMGIPVIIDSALYFEPHEDMPPAVPFVAFSFGRGKPLGIGFGGALLVRQAALDRYANATKQLELNAHRAKIHLPTRLIANMLLGSRPSLRLSSCLAGAKEIFLRPDNSDQPITALRPGELNALSKKILGRAILAFDISARADIVARGLALYREALGQIASPLGERLGARVRSGAIAPVLAILVERRDSLVRALRQAGIDCPVYWRYTVAARCGQSGFPGAGRLAKMFLGLPLTSALSPKRVVAVRQTLLMQKIIPFN